MTKVRSKHKGDILEDKVYSFIQEQIDSDNFIANKKLCKVYKQKAYYSRDRQANIIVDVSVEVTYPNTKEYSLLIIFECKNYKSSVSIDNIEEFASKLSQIAGHNVKGVMVTSSRYSRNGLNIARARGIGLARLSTDDKISYDVYRKTKSLDCDSNLIENLLCLDDNPQSFCAFDNTTFDNWLDYLKYLEILDEVSPNLIFNVPYLSKDKIKNDAEKLLEEYSPNVFKLIQATPLKELCSDVLTKLSLDFIYDEELGYSNGHEVLEKISFNPPTIYISARLKNDVHRWRFTLAHELGHYFLHSELISKMVKDNIDTVQSINAKIGNEALKRMELQANLFASNLLMPELAFKALVQQRFLFDNIKGGVLILDDQYCNSKTFHRVAHEISRYFNVSKESAKYKLMELGFLDIRTSLHVIRDFFDNPTYITASGII